MAEEAVNPAGETVAVIDIGSNAIRMADIYSFFGVGAVD